MACGSKSYGFGLVSTLSLSLFYLGNVIQLAAATITVVSQNSNATVYSVEENGVETSFAYGLKGRLIYSNPSDACRKPAPPPLNGIDNNSTFNFTLLSKPTKWILIATLAFGDDSCPLSRKAKNAQAAGYSAIIIQHLGSNNSDNALPGFVGLDWVGVKVYTCIVGNHEGDVLKNYTYPKLYLVKFENEPAFNAGFLGNITILIFFCVIGFCVCIRGACYCYAKICFGFEERRRKRRTLLTASELKKLPIVQWVPELPQETCSICLENFVVKEQVRLLPCSHVFHVQCIDPWLLQERRKCPNCKRRVIFLREHCSDSDSSSTTTEDENEPLLREPTDHSRFIQALTDSHNHRHSQPCNCIQASIPYSSKGSVNSQSSLQGPSTLSDVTVHCENVTLQITRSTTPSCLSITPELTSSCSSSEGETYKPPASLSEREEELMGKSHSTTGTNDESLSFHSCQETESDRDELYASIEQKA